MAYGQGVSMLIPLAFEPEWTRINDGVFNDYPPPPPPPPRIDPASTAGQIAQVIRESVQGVPVPNGPVDWENPTTAATIPITALVNTNNPFVNGNKKRNLLIIQNSSEPNDPTTDVAPDLLVSFAARVLPTAGAIRLKPGVGLILDTIVPRDDVYVMWQGGTGTFTTEGTLTQGSHSPNGPAPGLRAAPAFGAGIGYAASGISSS